jgi:hypothetical protein
MIVPFLIAAARASSSSVSISPVDRPPHRLRPVAFNAFFSAPKVNTFADVLLGYDRPGHPRKLRGIYAAEAA